MILSSRRGAVWSVLAFAAGAAAVQDPNGSPGGLRAWYAEGGQGENPSPLTAAETFTLRGTPDEPVTVWHQVWSVKLLGRQWDVVANGEESVPRPGEEGPFWISPHRLAVLSTDGSVQGRHWDGRVEGRGLFTANRLPVSPLPLRPLFLAGRRWRDRVGMKSARENEAVLEYLFDVASRPLPGRYESTGPVTLVLPQMAINYVFALRRAFPEGDGPHVGFRGYYDAAPLFAGRLTVSFGVASPYRAEWAAEARHLLMPAGGVPTTSRMEASDYDAENNMVRTSRTAIPCPPPEPWPIEGDPLYVWVPPFPFGVPRRTRWDSVPARTGGGPVFQGSQDTRFCRLAFGPSGSLAHCSGNHQPVGLSDTSDAQGLHRTRIFVGPKEYPTRLQPAVPSGVALIRPWSVECFRAGDREMTRALGGAPGSFAPSATSRPSEALATLAADPSLEQGESAFGAPLQAAGKLHELRRRQADAQAAGTLALWIGLRLRDHAMKSWELAPLRQDFADAVRRSASTAAWPEPARKACDAKTHTARISPEDPESEECLHRLSESVLTARLQRATRPKGYRAIDRERCRIGEDRDEDPNPGRRES